MWSGFYANYTKITFHCYPQRGRGTQEERVKVYRRNLRLDVQFSGDRKKSAVVFEIKGRGATWLDLVRG